MTTPLAPDDLHIGQPVRVFRDHDRDQPEDGWLATVVKVGSKLVTIQRLDTLSEETFRIETQRSNGNPGSRFRTLTQVLVERQAQTDRATLARHGLVLDWQARPKPEVLRRVAAVLDGMES